MTVAKLFLASLFALAAGLAAITLSTANYDPELDALFTPSYEAAAAVDALAATARPEGVTQNAPRLAFRLDTTTTVTSTATLTGSAKIADAITRFFSGTVTATQVIALRNAGWGYGEIFRLYLLAQRSGKTAADVQAMRDAGMGWGEIAQKLGLTPGNKGVNLGAAVSGRGITGTMTNTVGSKPNPPGKQDFTPPGQSKKDTKPDGGQGKGNGNPPGNGNSPGKGKGK